MISKWPDARPEWRSRPSHHEPPTPSVSHGLPRQFDRYTILQLTDLHISRLFPASCARAVVERSKELGVDLIAITGDIEPLRDLKATEGVYVISSNTMDRSRLWHP